MNIQSNQTTAPISPKDVLPDQVDRAEVNGVMVRKGTVAAFLQNAMRWSDTATPAKDRDAFEREITNSIPALQALGVFSVFELRDERLHAFMKGR